ncbi:zinc finger, CCHC-type containing protein [Tanacetum coccineum]
MSGEAASSKNKITMSTESASLPKVMPTQAASSKTVLLWDVSAVTGHFLITDLVDSDARGNVIHCTARANIAHNFIKLKEGGIYTIKNFVVQPNKDEYRIRKDDCFMLEFDGETTVRKSLAKADGFVMHPFELVKLESVQPTNNKHLIDVVGYMTNVRRVIQQRTGSRTLDFYLANQRGHDAVVVGLQQEVLQLLRHST